MRPIIKRAQRLTGAGLLVLGVIGCKDLTGSQQLPSGTTNPKFYNTRQGALLQRNSAMLQFATALQRYVVESGLFTDELQDAKTDAGQGTLLLNGSAIPDPLDERILPEQSTSTSLDGSQSYTTLQGARAFAAQALGMLAAYDTAAADVSSQRSLRSELYSLTGYAEILLADLFCSGVPLSTLDFQRDFTYHAGSTTAQVYQDAIAQFDSALALADTSTQMQNLARVGLGRAYLDRQLYDSAAAAVQGVPDAFRYQISTPPTAEWGSGDCSSLGQPNRFTGDLNCLATVSDSEGGRGLPYISSSDPRSAVFATFKNTVSGDSMYMPRKYQAASAGSLTLTVASAVEARLIQAEVALHNGGDWLTILKTLHDTLPGVTPLTDPGAALSGAAVDSARVALLFRERAEWLFLAGSRQGDLRRLLRQYGQYWRDQSRAYPTGLYTAPGAGRYGTDVTAPIPASESVNPLFHGCLNRAP